MREKMTAERAPQSRKTALISKQHKSIPLKSISSPAEYVMFLQRTIGNRAVQRMIKSGAIHAKLGICSPWGQIRARRGSSATTRHVTGNASSAFPELESLIDAIKGSGQPLPESSRAFFEPLFGQDFSTVRIHNDAKGAGIARTLNAKALTAGRDIVFGAG